MFFDIVIITAPTESIAQVYQVEVDKLKGRLPCLRDCKHVKCFSDPKGKRVGSGGGTLNALQLAKTHWTEEVILQSKTLIIHSGGDSKRAPLHSVCGKAWASLNTNFSRDIISNPLSLLLTELSSIVQRIPTGSLTVASCDVLLDLSPRNDLELQSINIPLDAVTIVVVPESPETAKNHVKSFTTQQ